jgi:hypothetical protein
VKQDDVVRLVGELVVAGMPEAWAARTPNEFPAACRFCGDPMLITLREVDGRVRVGIGHPDPLCAEFARRYEDVE